jgi:hypothetical protein
MKLLNLGFSLLDPALSEISDACIKRSLDSGRVYSLGHRDQRHLIGRAPCPLASPGDALL